METEIKLAPVLPHQAKLVLSDGQIAPFLSLPRRLRMHSDYYDTASGSLAALGFALRLRSENGRTVCALKGRAAGPGTRHEFEQQAQSLSDGVAALLAQGDIPGDAACMLRAGGFEKTCSVIFTRTAYDYKNGCLELELCHDEGQTEKGPLFGSVCELELELKSGDYAGLKALADYICTKYGLNESHIGKRAQAMALGAAQSGRALNPFFVGAEMLNFCVRSKYIELKLGEDGQLRYFLTPAGEYTLPRLFGVSFNKPCAFAGGEADE